MEHSYFDLLEVVAELGASSGQGRDDTPPASAAPAELGSPFPYLESESSTSEEEVVTPTGRLMCKRLGCGSVWCGCGCGMSKGLTLRDALRIELESFRSPYFVTLTINQDRFEDGPEGALRWISDQGVISEFVRKLRQGGHLLDKRYVSVLEFQKNGWPHWHLIFDASFVPFDEICEAWAAAGWAGAKGKARWGVRPGYEGKGQKPVFGGVRFRQKGRLELGAICHYLTKYVTQMPEEGWPAWVTASTRQLRRWSTSRDFWRCSSPPRNSIKVTAWSKLRGKYFDPHEDWEEDAEFLVKMRKFKRTIGQRVESCGSQSVVLEEVLVSSIEPGGLDVVRWRYVGMINADVWRDPDLEHPTFKVLDELGYRSFVISDDWGKQILRSLLPGGAS